MNTELLACRAGSFFEKLCAVEPNRRTDSTGNREAVRFAAERLRGFGLELETPAFECLDCICRNVEFACRNERFHVLPSPYSPRCDVEEELMPKKSPFYNPEEHRRIYGLLEENRPAAVITATRKNPETVGAVDPFPMIADGE